MPDTGAPWNIPYVEASDLVRDYPAASLALGTAIAGGLSSAKNAGIGSNAVQSVKTDTFSIASATFTDVTDLAVTITPTTDTSKILVMVFVLVAGAAGVAPIQARLLRDSTVILESAAGTVKAFAAHEEAGNRGGGYTPVVIDSPATASAVTYKVQVRTASGTGFVGRSADNTTHSASSIIAIEVAV